MAVWGTAGVVEWPEVEVEAVGGVEGGRGG